MTSQPPKPLPPPSKPRRFTYHAAFSYSSKDTCYVRHVLAALPKGIKVYDYQTPETNLPNVGLPIEKILKHIYEYEAMLVFAFLSKAYANGDFTQIEWETASTATKRKPRYLIPVLFKETLEETGMSVSLICLGGKLPAEELAVLIEETIRCPPRRPWWFFLSAELKVAMLLALIVALILIQPSRTRILSANANKQAITVHVANIGPWSATVVGQRLKFGALPIENAELRIENTRIAPGVHDVTLTTTELLTKCNDDGIRPKNDKVEPLLDQQPVTLEIDIRESDDAPGQSRRQIATFPAARLKPLVERLVSGRDTPCYDSSLRFPRRGRSTGRDHDVAS